ncbi:hypothetical protein E2C01_078455 [Portunus trituberculatus]|uniref:Uncharacterized protein n=1 Tax=Portunus trituberculatus TaxID=210409 RepID=A0A5B7INW0_PORTR|nr:hypothetical protein [Portunus trituberculatus]
MNRRKGNKGTRHGNNDEGNKATIPHQDKERKAITLTRPHTEQEATWSNTTAEKKNVENCSRYFNTH